MNGSDLKLIRKKLGLSKLEFMRVLGFTAGRLNVITVLHRMEAGKNLIPLHVARLAWLIGQYHEMTAQLPAWPIWPRYTIINDEQPATPAEEPADGNE